MNAGRRILEEPVIKPLSFFCEQTWSGYYGMMSCLRTCKSFCRGSPVLVPSQNVEWTLSRAALIFVHWLFFCSEAQAKTSLQAGPCRRVAAYPEPKPYAPLPI